MFTWIINIFKGKKNKLQEQIVITSPDGKQSVVVNNKAIPEITPEERAKNDKKRVLKESLDKLNKLKIYVNYFDFPYITSIYNQSVILHEIFESNDELNMNKLDQFHMYYTDHLLEMLQKIKKSHDEHYVIVSAQVKSYESKISTLKDYIVDIVNNDIKESDNIKARYSQNMVMQLNSIYNCLIDKFDDFRFKTSKNLKLYSQIKKSNLFYQIPSELFTSIIDFNYENNYKYQEFWVERKLMGRLQKNLFNIKFVNVFICGDLNFELFKIDDTNDHFIYVPNTCVFKFVDYNTLKAYIAESNTKYGSYNLELETYTKKLTELKIKKDDIRNFDDKTINTIKGYMEKIEDVELVEKITSIDVERQNLESILKLERLEI